MKFRSTLAAVAVLAVSAPVAISVTPAFAGTTGAVRAQSTVAQLERAAAEADAAYQAVKAEQSTLELELGALLDHGPVPQSLQDRLTTATAALRDAEAGKAAADRVRADRYAVVEAVLATGGEEERVAALRELNRADLAVRAAEGALVPARQENAAAKRAVDDWRVGVVRRLGESRKAVEQALAAKQGADRALAEGRAAAARETVGTPTATAVPSTVGTPTPAGGAGASAAVTPSASPSTVATATAASTVIQAETPAGTPAAAAVPTQAPTPAPGSAATGTAELAETGASTVAPVIAVAGGAAMALGVGALVVARRRRGDGEG
ncbi:LPXTG cell wall anchor domain-containing protein [Kitasatospora sp. NPDC002040]|uniref:LPXTG cell wall anchor domain-containing protein n=1 Tax=Kitasatospora sp. NPDC002040 TaxID=3154661 RepID=UPI00331C8404